MCTVSEIFLWLFALYRVLFYQCLSLADLPVQVWILASPMNCVRSPIYMQLVPWMQWELSNIKKRIKHGRWGMEYPNVYSGCAKFNFKKYLFKKKIYVVIIINIVIIRNMKTFEILNFVLEQMPLLWILWCWKISSSLS